MTYDDVIRKRFEDLDNAEKQVGRHKADSSYLDDRSWQQWSNNVLNLFIAVLGRDSNYYNNFKSIYDNNPVPMPDALESAIGIFKAAKIDFEAGFIFSLKNKISGEIFGDFIALAKESLREGQKDVAAVLSCAAMEDALKNYALQHSLQVDDKSMYEVVSALKSKGLVSGAQKALLNAMPKIRNYAMHANWDKITPEDVGSVIGFVEQMLLRHF